ncbi:MAG: imidazole glycerol phosphate synthase subunit HisH [Candidatus Omnitrophota bacterium]|jgi:glutamine amidotransferase|nr:MAG: imidazole glycerol phosphate synthase subunit HisH [Candidatus Omnitrophota bacterium]
MICIIDYGMGNIHSVKKAIESMGKKTIVTNSPKDLDKCEKIVFPGVGAFDDAIDELRRVNLVDSILKQVSGNKFFLGICLGMQVLFESSQEALKEKGLGLLTGSVKLFDQDLKVKVPHMGWNQLNIINGACPLLKDIKSGSFVYFCHSYYPEPADKSIIAASTEYGVNFSSIIWKNNIFGVQFHPEKSQDTGMKILRNFIDL